MSTTPCWPLRTVAISPATTIATVIAIAAATQVAINASWAVIRKLGEFGNPAMRVVLLVAMIAVITVAMSAMPVVTSGSDRNDGTLSLDGALKVIAKTSTCVTLYCS